MTNKGAIKNIDWLIDWLVEKDARKEVIDALNVAIEALEKQIPNTPIMVDNCGNTTASDRCCKCHEIVDCTYSYCPYCGQMIDWGDAE